MINKICVPMSFDHLETVYLNILKYELTLYIAYIIPKYLFQRHSTKRLNITPENKTIIGYNTTF